MQSRNSISVSKKKKIALIISIIIIIVNTLFSIAMINEVAIMNVIFIIMNAIKTKHVTCDI